MNGCTKAEILRAVLGNLKQHDFTVNGKFAITEEEGAVLLEALKDYKYMCETEEFYYVPFPAAVFVDNTVFKRKE